MLKQYKNKKELISWCQHIPERWGEKCMTESPNFSFIIIIITSQHLFNYCLLSLSVLFIFLSTPVSFWLLRCFTSLYSSSSTTSQHHSFIPRLICTLSVLSCTLLPLLFSSALLSTSSSCTLSTLPSYFCASLVWLFLWHIRFSSQPAQIKLSL